MSTVAYIVNYSRGIFSVSVCRIVDHNPLCWLTSTVVIVPIVHLIPGISLARAKSVKKLVLDNLITLDIKMEVNEREYKTTLLFYYLIRLKYETNDLEM
jgi:hypothetical protein